MLAHVDNRITYSGNGNATEFAYQFKILDRTDIKVLLTDADGKEKLLTKDYYVDVEKSVVRYPGYAVGAEVPESERPAVLPAGWKLTIYREVLVTQETDLPDQYPFNQVEDIGDKLTMIAQQLTDTTGRSLKIGVSKSTDIDTVIPWENGKSFRISDDGKNLELSEDPAKVLPLAQGVYAQTQAQAQYASLSAASAAESARLAEGYKNVAETAKSDASLYAANAKTYADNAGASKEAAQSAATTASNFASDARNSAGEAKTYKDNARNSAGEAKTYKDNAKTCMDNAKNYSENVNVFVPSVSSDGVLSWTNKAGLANPPAVTLSGGGSNVTVDTALSDTSTNPVQNKVIKAALDNRAVLDDANTFTSPNRFDDIYMQNGINSLKWYDGSPNFVVGYINSKSYTGNATTATKATQDSAGNVITDTYATKTDISGVVKSVNGVQPDTSGNVSITGGGGSNAAVDTTLSATSTNAIANKTVYSALGGKLGKTETAYAATKATQDDAGNVITETYTKKADFDKTIGQLQVAFQEKVDRSDLSDVATSGQYSDLRGKPEYVVQSVNNVRPDENGNVSISVSGGGGVSTSESNTWTAQQNFHDLMLNREKYTTYVVNGASDTPVTSTMVYAVTGAFTLNLATLAGALSASQSSVFTAYFAANADYSLTISNAGKLKYTGSASDVAITTSGLLLNIWMSKDGGGTLTSIVQASKLS